MRKQIKISFQMTALAAALAWGGWQHHRATAAGDPPDSDSEAIANAPNTTTLARNAAKNDMPSMK